MQNFDINDSQPISDKPSERKKNPLREIEKKENSERRTAKMSTRGNWQLVGRGQGAREYRRLMQNALSPRK